MGGECLAAGICMTLCNEPDAKQCYNISHYAAPYAVTSQAQPDPATQRVSGSVCKS